MSNKSGYKQQQNLSIAQLLAELPNFAAVLPTIEQWINFVVVYNRIYYS